MEEKRKLDYLVTGKRDEDFVSETYSALSRDDARSQAERNGLVEIRSVAYEPPMPDR